VHRSIKLMSYFGLSDYWANRLSDCRTNGLSW